MPPALPSAPAGAGAGPLRIALFSEVYWPMVSGVGVTLVRLADALRARGHEVRVYSAAYALPPGETERPEAHRSPSLPFFLYPDVQWAFPRLRDVLEDVAHFRPDVVHTATEFAMGIAGLRAAQKLGLPLVASAHTDYERYAGRYGMEWLLRTGWHYLRWFYGHAGRVLCPSRYYEGHLHRRGIRHTGIWTRGVDGDVFHPRWRSAAFRASLGAGEGDLVVTYIGRLAKEKNLDLLLDAWAALAPRLGNARLVFVGRGPYAAEIRRRALPGVHLTGLLTGEALSAAYASADLFVFPSTTETFGNSVLEAMASGLPCIVAAAGGLLEFAVHGENAWLVEPDSGDAVVAALERLAGDAGLRRTLAQGALRTAQARQWDGIYDQLLADYRAVAAAKHGSPAR
ncbi:MAG TPA: glycosyltransferase family 1 protein [Gemmatimonadales bacterium]|nr:glycosyltransferase family 1 protein [Gemmatimonadales bacterium]